MPEAVDLQSRIDALVESVRGDDLRARHVFDYVWSMMCVNRGLMRVVRAVDGPEVTQLVLEEVRSGRHRVVSRPYGLDADIEGLAVEALFRMLEAS